MRTLQSPVKAYSSRTGNGQARGGKTMGRNVKIKKSLRRTLQEAHQKKNTGAEKVEKKGGIRNDHSERGSIRKENRLSSTVYNGQIKKRDSSQQARTPRRLKPKPKRETQLKKKKNSHCGEGGETRHYLVPSCDVEQTRSKNTQREKGGGKRPSSKGKAISLS